MVMTPLRIALVVALLAGVFAPTNLYAETPQEQAAMCQSPRTAVETWIENSIANQVKPELATLCFDFSQGPTTSEEQLQVARDLLSVLDGQGKLVVYDSLPSEAEYTNPTSGLPHYTLFPTLPDIELRKTGEVWLLTPRTVLATESLVQSTYKIPLDRWARKLPDSLQKDVIGIALWRWVGLALVLLLSVVLGKIGEWTLVGFLRRVFRRFLGWWNETFEKKLLRRANLLITATIASILLPNLGLGVHLNQALMLAAKLVISLAGVMMITAVIDLVFDSWAKVADDTDSKMDDQLIPLLRRAAKGITYVVGFLFILQNMDIDVGSLLAGLGIGGLAFALAAKDTLANLFGSLTIFTDQPFQIGDYVVVAGIEGSIEEVGFRSTRVRTGADSVITVPNSAIANSTIDNLGKRRCRRYKTQLGISYDSSPEQIEAFVEGVRASILSSPFTQKHRFDVGLHSFGDSALNIFVSLYFDVAGFSDELQARHHLHLEWLRLADSLGVGFAFPTQTLHVDTLGPQGRAPLPDAPAAFAEVVRGFGPGGAMATPETPAFTEEFWPEEPI